MTATSRVFRSADLFAKNIRRYVDHPSMVAMQKANGLDMGVTLHSRYSAALILSSITSDMKANICDKLIAESAKISVLVDESTTNSNSSALIVYIRVVVPNLHSSFVIPLELVDLVALDASTITTAILDASNNHGFSDDYLGQHWIGVCSDGASTMVSNKTGVLTQLKAKFPSLLLWHCMCHRIELAVGDAIDIIGAVNHAKAFLDKSLLNVNDS